MKIKEISLNNFAEYSKVTVSLDPNINFFVGKNGSGKTTLGLTGVQAIFQGIAEKATNGTTPVIAERFRFIGPTGATSKNHLILIDEKNNNAEIKISRKITKTGSELQIEAPESYGQLNQEWLNSLFNIFLISPKKFCELTAKEQARALGIDTKKFDDEIAVLKKQYTEINAVYRSFGELAEVEKVEKVDLTELQMQKNELRVKLNGIYLENKKANEETRNTYNSKRQEIIDEVTKYNEEQVSLRRRYNAAFDALSIIKNAGYTGTDVDSWLNTLVSQLKEGKNATDLFPPEPEYIQELPDDSELKSIDDLILSANETNQKALLYEQYLQKKAQKEAKEKELKTNRDSQAAKEADRLEYIKSFKFPFSNLSVGEDGELLLNGKPIKSEYFSTGELLKIIPVLIATTQPELKYVFLQDFNLMDDEKQKEIEEFLTSKGFQLVVEIVGKEKITEKNCILLRDNVVVENYKESGTEMPI